MARNDQGVRTIGAPDGWTDPTTSHADGPVWRRWTPLVTWLLCLTGAIVLLRWLGAGDLAVPVLHDPAAWRAWFAATEPVTAAVAVLRVLAIGLAWYLTGVTGVSVVARLLEAASLVRFADALSFGPVRILVQQAVGVGLAASVLTTAVPTAAVATVGDEVAVMVPIETADEEPTQAVAATGLALRDPVPAPVPAPGAATAQAGPVAAAEPVAGAAAEAEAGQRPTLRERKIAAGDHFWAIAEEEVATQLGRPGTEDEVLDHWETLLVVNADRLVVAGNADLLLPGQTIVLPEVTEVAP